MFRLLEETRSLNLQNEHHFKEKFQEDIRNKEKQIEQLNSQINYLQDQLQIEVRIFIIIHSGEILFSF
jgi:hypothetical protein